MYSCFIFELLNEQVEICTERTVEDVTALSARVLVAVSPGPRSGGGKASFPLPPAPPGLDASRLRLQRFHQAGLERPRHAEENTKYS